MRERAHLLPSAFDTQKKDTFHQFRCRANEYCEASDRGSSSPHEQISPAQEAIPPIIAPVGGGLQIFAGAYLFSSSSLHRGLY